MILKLAVDRSSRVIWLGDLNYRLALPDKETWTLVKRGDWAALLRTDQVQVSSIQQQSYIVVTPFLQVGVVELAYIGIVENKEITADLSVEGRRLQDRVV